MADRTLAELAVSLAPDFELLPPTPKTSHLTRFLHGPTGLEFVYLPGGTVTIGLTEAQEAVLRVLVEADLEVSFIREWDFAEKPAVSVTLKPFLLAVTPVSEALAGESIALDEEASRYDTWDEAEPLGLTWDEVSQLCEAYGLEVPSESQWEYAYRAGAQTLFPWGDELPEDEFLDQVVCFFRLGEVQDLDEHRNAWGLVAMQTGEWCADDYEPDHNNLPVDGSPVRNHDAEGRVVKGGAAMSWPWQGCGEWMSVFSAMRLAHTELENQTASLRFVKNLG